MPNDGKTTTDVYQRFPKNRKTLGVHWPKHHGVTAPLSSIKYSCSSEQRRQEKHKGSIGLVIAASKLRNMYALSKQS